MTEYTFNPPPGWPPAPPGWVPPAGWRPDPSWPPAPDGWLWWLPVPEASAPPAPAPPPQTNAATTSAAPAVDLTTLPPPVPAAVTTSGDPAPHDPTWRERLAARHEAKELHERQAAWADEQAELDRTVATVRQLVAGPGVAVSLVLKPGEQAVWTGDAQLVEPRRGPGHYAGGSQGVSFRIAKGVRYRVGASRGHYIPGDEVQTVIDRGTATVTTQRVVFTGSQATREWSFAKLLDTEISRDHTLVLIHVSNRQKASGIKADPAFAEALGLGITVAQNGSGGPAALLATVTREADQHRTERPGPG